VPRTLTHPLPTPAAGTLLGFEHPLARVQQRISVRLEQAAVVGAVLAAGVVAMTAAATEALAAILACVVAEVGLAVSLATLTSDRRACVINLLIEGRGGLPLPVVRRERRRLLAPAHRHERARSLRELTAEAQRNPVRPLSGRPLYTRAVLVAVAPELDAIASRLDAGPVALGGAALTERLLTAHDSPLYGLDAAGLRQELRRIGFALELYDESSSRRCQSWNDAPLEPCATAAFTRSQRPSPSDESTQLASGFAADRAMQGRRPPPSSIPHERRRRCHGTASQSTSAPRPGHRRGPVVCGPHAGGVTPRRRFDSTGRPLGVRQSSPPGWLGSVRLLPVDRLG
jgi:hypothetical protein